MVFGFLFLVGFDSDDEDHEGAMFSAFTPWNRINYAQ